MVVTDGWQGYRGLDKLGYSHVRHSQRAARFRGEDPGKLLPAVHQVISLAKRWLLGTHQGAADDAHLASYLNEFVFRWPSSCWNWPGSRTWLRQAATEGRSVNARPGHLVAEAPRTVR